LIEYPENKEPHSMNGALFCTISQIGLILVIEVSVNDGDKLDTSAVVGRGHQNELFRTTLDDRERNAINNDKLF
jgi:hypothetical protein